MIKITGNRGEGAGLLTNLAIEKFLETSSNSNKVCFLIDDSGEFLPLVDKFKGIDVYIDGIYESEYSEILLTYTKYVEEKLYKTNFFRFVLNWEDKKEIRNIEKFAKELQEKYNLWIFVIYKTVN